MGELIIKRSATLYFLFLLLLGSHAQGASALDKWLSQEVPIAKTLLLENISPSGTAAGVVVASPSKSAPNYFFHWIRDSALVMSVIGEWYLETNDASAKAEHFQLLKEYIDFSRGNQLTSNPSGGVADGGLGEPKFNVDGSAFKGPWGRPQNDGPALRAITLTKLAEHWLGDGHEKLVKEKLYRSEIPASTIIKADLEYVSHHWDEASFDLWEETKGDHFYTRMVQRRALLEGAHLADRLKDEAAAKWYRKQAGDIEAELQMHWDEKKGILVATRNRTGGIGYKSSGLDTAVILGVLHGATGDEFFSVADAKVEATALKLEQSFASLYAINKNGQPGIAMGRYPEDEYDGAGNSEGNPWFLITAGFAEYYYSLIKHYDDAGVIDINDENLAFFKALGVPGISVGAVAAHCNPKFDAITVKLKAKGDDFLRRIQAHGASDGHLSEQMNRESGYMQGARDLTWNYASLITAFESRP